MTDWIGDAWSGWTGYTDKGKLPALLLAVLLFVWFSGKWREQKGLLAYTTAMTACCIFPVTAAGWMMYQTRFYDYEWIWSLVPATAVTAYGMTLFWTEYRNKNAGKWNKLLPVILLLLTALVFCGSLGGGDREGETQKAEREKVHALLVQLSDRYPEMVLCLWAPREVMEYAREEDASVTLPYGRNLWDAFLNAYAYDTYDQDILTMEKWMEHVGSSEEAQGDTEDITLEECVAMAQDRGVNCILLPPGASAETIRRMEAALGITAEPLAEFSLFITCQ